MAGQDAIAAALGELVEAGALAGAATLVWRGGRIAQAGCVGWRDVDARLPVERDTLFRIASLTKPITSTAALMLLEEGRFALDEPITRWAPEFASMQVLRSASGPLDEIDPAGRPITFEDLLTHRSGLTYGGFQGGELAAAHAATLGGDIDSHLSPDDWIAGLAGLPLIAQPGTAFNYGHSTDLLGLLIARMEGASLGEVLERRIFGPLGMKDTGFVIPRDRLHRRAAPCGFDQAGRPVTRSMLPGEAALPERPDDMTFVSGGQGLWSTLDDYLAFARMFVGQGSVDGVRLLKPETLAMMTGNRMTQDQRAAPGALGASMLSNGHGFGLGVAVVMDPEQATPMPCGGGRGAVGWPGAYGGWWRADPNDGSVLVFLAHNMTELEQLMSGIGIGVYEAIARFQALAGEAA